MTTTTYRPLSRSDRFVSLPAVRKSRLNMNLLTRYAIGIDAVLIILWVILASSGAGQLNRMSATQSKLTERNNRLISANQQMKSQYIFDTSAGVIGDWAAQQNLVKETAPVASVDMDRNQASAASR